MIKMILILAISFRVGFLIKGMKFKKKTKKFKKVKPLSKMNKKEYKKAMKDLEIK